MDHIQTLSDPQAEVCMAITGSKAILVSGTSVRMKAAVEVCMQGCALFPLSTSR